MNPDLTFPIHYSCEVLPELPNGGCSPYYFGPSRNSTKGQDGLIVQIEGNNKKPWFGMFAFGRVSSEGLTGLWSCPSPDQLCIVSRGLGYIVNTKEPLQYEVLALQPILHVLPIRSHDLLAVGDFTCLLAYGINGVRWKTARLSWDGLKIDNITTEHIIGQGWDPSQEKHVPFRVDIVSGQHEGGGFGVASYNY